MLFTACSTCDAIAFAVCKLHGSLHSLPVAPCLHSHSLPVDAAVSACEPPESLQLLPVHVLHCLGPQYHEPRAALQPLMAAHSDCQQRWPAVRCVT